MKIVVINGPNLNLLGSREPETYGTQTLSEISDQLQKLFPVVQFVFLQSNVEGELINMIQEHGFSADGIILNAGGYAHTSVSIGDAVKSIPTPVVEVHISNVFSRESFRHISFISPHAKGCIIGFGTDVYKLAVMSFLTSD